MSSTGPGPSLEGDTLILYSAFSGYQKLSLALFDFTLKEVKLEIKTSLNCI